MSRARRAPIPTATGTCGTTARARPRPDKGEPPNNWQSDFGHSAWEWDEKTRQYYYHKFYIQQPDLNWNNPKVHQAFKDIIAFWLKRGVGGFRFDAITTLFEDPEMRDEDVLLDKDGKSLPQRLRRHRAQRHPHQQSARQCIPSWQEMRAVADKFDSNKFPGSACLDRRNLPAQHRRAGQAVRNRRTSPSSSCPWIRRSASSTSSTWPRSAPSSNDAETDLGGNMPLLLFDNHDNPRIDARYGDGVHNTDIERVISTMLFASRGASLFYYGDEIGMKTTPPTRKEDVKDPVGITGWPKEKGRDGERTPMQWDASAKRRIRWPQRQALAAGPAHCLHHQRARRRRAIRTRSSTWYQDPDPLKKTNPAFVRGRRHHARHRKHQGAELDAPGCGSTLRWWWRSTSRPSRKP